MLNAITRFSLHFRGAICTLTTIVTYYGLYTFTRAKFDVLPELAPPVSIIHAEASGLTSEQVETPAIQLLENALGGMVGLWSMRSRSMQGLSATTLVFNDHANVLQVRQLVTERINGVATTPLTGVMPPRPLSLTTTTSVMQIIGITSKTRSLMDLYDITQWVVRPQLLNVPGVADVIVLDDDARQIQVQVDPAELIRYGLSVQSVIVVARLSTGVRGAGFIGNNNQRIAVNINGQTATPQKLAGVVLRWSNGTAMRLGNVATVARGSTPPVGAASIMGQARVQLVLESQYGTNTLIITKGIEKTLNALGPVLV